MIKKLKPPWIFIVTHISCTFPSWFITALLSLSFKFVFLVSALHSSHLPFVLSELRFPFRGVCSPESAYTLLKTFRTDAISLITSDYVFMFLCLSVYPFFSCSDYLLTLGKTLCFNYLLNNNHHIMEG